MVNSVNLDFEEMKSKFGVMLTVCSNINTECKAVSGKIRNISDIKGISDATVVSVANKVEEFGKDVEPFVEEWTTITATMQKKAETIQDSVGRATSAIENI